MAEEQDPQTRESPSPRVRAPAANPPPRESREVQPKKEDPPAQPPPGDKDEAEMVILSNKLPQTITVSTDSGNGPEELKLPPHGSSVPVNKQHLTAYTRSMIEKGHVKERAAKAKD